MRNEMKKIYCEMKEDDYEANRSNECKEIFDDMVNEATANGKNLKKMALNEEQLKGIYEDDCEYREKEQIRSEMRNEMKKIYSKLKEDVNRRYGCTQVFYDTVSEATANDKNLKRVGKNGEQSNANKIGDNEFSDTDVEDEEESGDEDDTADMISSDSGNEGESEYNPSDADGDSAADTKVNEFRIIKLV